MQNKARRILSLVFVGLFVTVLGHSGQTKNPCVTPACVSHACVSHACVVTVFVHGTVMPNPSFTALGSSVKYLFKKKKKNQSAYQKYLEEVKKEGPYKRQPINGLGLKAIDLTEYVRKKEPRYIAKQTAVFYKKVYDRVYEGHENSLCFYTFGWHGELRNKRRLQAAEQLYETLALEKQKLETLTKLPVLINLVTHSHGGNVALYLAPIEEKNKQDLKIDKLIMFGCPVQRETERFVLSPVFKKIYHVYSNGDTIQVADTISTKDFFSRREFGRGKYRISLPTNLWQISVEAGKLKPAHAELWLWGNKHFPHFLYRKNLDYYPFPLALFSPVIVNMVDQIDHADQLDGSLLSEQKVVLTIDKKKELFAFKQNPEFFHMPVALASLREEGLAVL